MHNSGKTGQSFLQCRSLVFLLFCICSNLFVVVVALAERPNRGVTPSLKAREIARDSRADSLVWRLLYIVEQDL
jgi:hypothetical protein